PRSEAFQARTTPGRARAAAVSTLASRAWASALRTTPRCSASSRVRSSTNRPPPVRRRWSSFRRGEDPIMPNAIYHARAGLASARLSTDGRRQAGLREAAVDAASRQSRRRAADVVLLPVRRLHGASVPGADLARGDRLLRRRLWRAHLGGYRMGLALGAPAGGRRSCVDRAHLAR